MKFPFVLLPMVLLAGCSKRHNFPIPPEKGFGNQVSWRIVVYDSNNVVVDSTRWIAVTDSIDYPQLLGPSVFNLAPLPGNDTISWQQPYFAIIVGPYNLGPQLGNTQIVKGGCGINSVYNDPTLDRTGWNLQRSENHKVINMFAAPVNKSYDGKYNDFPYPGSFNGVKFPSPGESNIVNTSWICGTTTGSCQLFPQL